MSLINDDNDKYKTNDNNETNNNETDNDDIIYQKYPCVCFSVLAVKHFECIISMS